MKRRHNVLSFHTNSMTNMLKQHRFGEKFRWGYRLQFAIIRQLLRKLAYRLIESRKSQAHRGSLSRAIQRGNVQCHTCLVDRCASTLKAVLCPLSGRPLSVDSRWRGSLSRGASLLNPCRCGDQLAQVTLRALFRSAGTLRPRHKLESVETLHQKFRRAGL